MALFLHPSRALLVSIYGAIYFLCFSSGKRREGKKNQTHTHKKTNSAHINHRFFPSPRPEMFLGAASLRRATTSAGKPKISASKTRLGFGSRPQGNGERTAPGREGGGGEVGDRRDRSENNKRSHFCNHVVPINTHCLLIKCLYDSSWRRSLHTTPGGARCGFFFSPLPSEQNDSKTVPFLFIFFPFISPPNPKPPVYVLKKQRNNKNNKDKAGKCTLAPRSCAEALPSERSSAFAPDNSQPRRPT